MATYYNQIAGLDNDIFPFINYHLNIIYSINKHLISSYLTKSNTQNSRTSIYLLHIHLFTFKLSVS